MPRSQPVRCDSNGACRPAKASERHRWRRRALAPIASTATVPAVKPRRRDLLLALAAGVVTALSVPPLGWWVLCPVGLAGLSVLPRGRGAGDGLLIGQGLWA